MDDAQTRGWIFLAVPEQPAALTDVIAMADAINHAIPTQQELRQSFDWLEAHGLVARVGRRYSLTESGVALRRRASSSTIMGTWENIAKEFRRAATPNI